MEYTSRLGDRPTQAHVNYVCPCGCDAGLTYDRESGSEHLGECCCGRLLWVGEDAEATVRSRLEAGVEYGLELDRVTLPWGQTTKSALAVPVSVLAAERSHEGHDHEPQAVDETVRDVVCGMTIDPRTAAATSEHAGTTYYFCAAVCKTRFDPEPARYVGA